MSDDQEPPTSPTVKVARDLTEILNLHTKLLTQAVHKATAHLMPGGEAMGALGADSDLDEWAEQIAYAELHHFAVCLKPDHSKCGIRGAEHVEDQDEEDPLRILRTWADPLRTQHGYPLDGRAATIETEANFLKWATNTIWQDATNWTPYARDVNRARVRLEDILYAGNREERTRVPCNQDDCARHPNLIKIYAPVDEDGTSNEHDDRWKCPACKHRYDHHDFQRAFAKQLRSDGALTYVQLRDAIGTLQGFGRSENTIRKWLTLNLRHEADVCPACDSSWSPEDRDRPCPDCGTTLEPIHVPEDAEEVIEGYCEISTHRTFVWWPDLWRKHLATKTRKRVG